MIGAAGVVQVCETRGRMKCGRVGQRGLGCAARVPRVRRGGRFTKRPYGCVHRVRPPRVRPPGTLTAHSNHMPRRCDENARAAI